MKKSYISFFILFTAITKTYVLWAYLFSISIATVTTIFFLVTLIIILDDAVKNKLRYNYWHVVLSVFLIVAPFVTMLGSFYIDVRTLLLQFFYLACFHLAYISILNYGRIYLYKLVIFSFLMIVIPGVVSVFNQAVFLGLANIADARVDYWGRAFGFYLQPNSFAIAVNMIYILFFLVCSDRNKFFYSIPVFFVAILLAGSRTNIACFAIISLIIFMFYFKDSYKNFFLSVLKTTLLVVVPLLIILPSFYATMDSDKFKYLVDRIDYVSQFFDNELIEEVSNDRSMQDRIEYQLVYIDRISEKPVLGYGFGIQEKMIERGDIIDSAHNTFLEILLQGGVLYFFLFFIFVSYCFYYYKTISRRTRLSYSYLAFILFMSFYFVFSTTFLTERLTYVMLGIFAGCNLRKDYE